MNSRRLLKKLFICLAVILVLGSLAVVILRQTHVADNYFGKLDLPLLGIEPSDTVAPLLNVLPMNIFLGEQPDYMKDVEVSDNSGHYELDIDSSQIDLQRAGDYPVVYTATDSLGNQTRREVTLRVKNRNRRVIYLTFDDGPSNNTGEVLRILREEGVKATFFITAQMPGCFHYIAQAHQEGHAVAAHSYSHKFSIYRSFETYFADLDRIEQVIEKYTGSRSPIIRFPGGSSNMAYNHYSDINFMDSLCREVQYRGYQYVDWNLDSRDASGNNVPVQRIVSSACRDLGGEICLLMHDAEPKKSTVAALPAIIRFFKERGYEFGTLTSTGYICHHNTANIRRMILKKRAEKAAKTAKAEKQKSQAAHTGDSLKLSN